jgi:ubiquinone/menaquinone biosynthesis C-methylase UbiE
VFEVVRTLGTLGLIVVHVTAYIRSVQRARQTEIRDTLTAETQLAESVLLLDGRYNLAEMGILEDKSNAQFFYKYLSKVYDQVNRINWTEEMRSEALEWLEFGANDRVLDVGCGTGFGTAGLLEYADNVHALDQSIHQMENAFEKFGKQGQVTFHMGDAERLPFTDNTFDIVWSSGSIEYWPNPIQGLKEIRRVAKPGGQILIVGPDYPSNPILQRAADAIMLFYDKDEADYMFTEAGFVDFHHYIQQASSRSPRAITTVARVPDENIQTHESFAASP